MVPVNFNQLYYFWVVTRSGSISLAAKRLLLTQSTLSVQMKQLESALGKKLLERDRRGAYPTPDGRHCADYCERIFPHAEELLSTLREDRPAKPILRFGVLPAVSRRKIMAVAAFARALCPGLTVKVRSAAAPDLRSGIERRTLDIVLSDLDMAPLLSVKVRSRLLARVPHYFIGTPEIKRRMGAFPRGLARIPLLLRTPGNPVRKALDEFLEIRGLSSTVHSEIDDPDFLRAMASAGEGACLMEVDLLRKEFASGRLVKLSSRPVVSEPYWLLASLRRHPHQQVERVIAGLMSRFRLTPPPAGR
jgi:LysR family transcriptional regulator, transcriptional activator of nhaA